MFRWEVYVRRKNFKVTLMLLLFSNVNKNIPCQIIFIFWSFIDFLTTSRFLKFSQMFGKIKRMAFFIRNTSFKGVNSTAQGFSVDDTMTDDSYFNIFEIELSITSLFSVQIMSYLKVSDIIYSDVIDSFIPEILTFKACPTRVKHVLDTL